MENTLFRQPKWLVYFYKLIDLIPIPKWLLIALIILISGVGHHLIAWRDGILDRGAVDLYLATVGVHFVLYPIYWDFLSRRANQHLKTFYSQSRESLENLNDHIADFNSLPENISFLAVLFGVSASIYSYYQIGLSEIPLITVVPWTGLLAYITIGSVGFLAFLRLVRQAFLMRRMYKQIQVDLFIPFRIYDLSGYASFSSISLILLFYGINFMSIPNFVYLPIGILWQFIIFVVVALLFFFPLLGINNRMRHAKEELLIQTGENLKIVYDQINSAAKTGDFVGLGKIGAPLSTLRDAKDIVEHIPTWPWQPSSIRNFFIPLIIPIIVYILQLLIESRLEF